MTRWAGAAAPASPAGQPGRPALQDRQFARDPVRAQGLQEAELAAAGSGGAMVGEIDDLALPDAFDGGMRLLDEALEALRQPVISAGLPAVAVHALLDDGPLALIRHDESVQVEVEAVLHGSAVHLGDKPARLRQHRPVEPDAFPDRNELLRRLSRMFSAAAADMDPKLSRARRQAALQRADHARGDAGGMPIHSHHRPEGLKPEGMGEAAQQLVAAIVMDDRLANDSAEAGHAIRQPSRYISAMQRQIRASRSACHRRPAIALRVFRDDSTRSWRTSRRCSTIMLAIWSAVWRHRR